jgi:protein-disulfide isomerase
MLLVTAACNKSCTGRKDSTDTQVDAAIKELRVPQAIDTQSLSKEQQASFTKLLNDEICPCGCPRSFADCLSSSEKKCEAGILLAQWAVGHLKAGTPERALYQAISDEINKGFMLEPLNVTTDDAHHKGPKSAPVTIIEFADFECPACKIAAKSLSRVIKDRPNDIQLYFMHMPLNSHPHAEATAVAAEAAARQNKFWEMHDALFAHEGTLNEAALNIIAATIFKPKELAQFHKDQKDPSLLAKVRSQKEYASKTLKLEGTPTFLFNGRPYNLSLSEDGFLLRLAMEKARTNNCINK